MLKRVLLAFMSILAAAALLRSEPVHAQGSVGAPGIQGGIPCFQGGSCGFSNTYVTQGGHINFGPTQGDAGYGIRDNGGGVQFKNSGGNWFSPAQPIAPVSHQWLKSIGTDGGPTLAQPDVSDVTGAFPTAGGTLTGVLGIGAGERQTPTPVSASTYTATTTDRVICVNSASNAVAITLPAALGTGSVVEVKDCGGAAATNNITLQLASGQFMIGNGTGNTAYDSIKMTVGGMALVIKDMPSVGWKL